MALMGRKIAAIRAYVVEGGGASYHGPVRRALDREETDCNSDEYLSGVQSYKDKLWYQRIKDSGCRK